MIMQKTKNVVEFVVWY